MSCPDLVVLSQLADGELPEGEARSVAAHVAACERCGAWLERARRALDALSAAAASGRSPQAAVRTDDCPPPSVLAGWRDAALPTAERSAVSRHLEGCDVCFPEVLAATHLLARLDATPALPVPAALQARVAASWQQDAAPGLSELVVRVTRAGAQLIESHLLAPLRELVELPLPLPAMRGGTEAQGLHFRLRASPAVITATVMPAGDGVGLTLVIEDETGGVLADQRIFLRRHGRSIYSARTDTSGALRVPSLERGVYEVRCPGIGTSFRLDLRA